MAARQGPRAGPPRRRRLESGACQGEGRSGPVSSRQREIPHVRRSRHRRGRRPRSHRAVLHDLISWLSPSAVPGAWNQYLLAGPEAPVSSCRPLPDGPPQQHTDPPPTSRSQAVRVGAGLQATRDPQGAQTGSPAQGPPAPRSLPVGGGGLCANPDPAPISCPLGSTHGRLRAQGPCTSMRVMGPACRVAMGFPRPTQHLANSSAQ